MNRCSFDSPSRNPIMENNEPNFKRLFSTQFGLPSGDGLVNGQPVEGQHYFRITDASQFEGISVGPQSDVHLYQVSFGELGASDYSADPKNSIVISPGAPFLGDIKPPCVISPLIYARAGFAYTAEIILWRRRPSFLPVGRAPKRTTVLMPAGAGQIALATPIAGRRRFRISIDTSGVGANLYAAYRVSLVTTYKDNANHCQGLTLGTGVISTPALVGGPGNASILLDSDTPSASGRYAGADWVLVTSLDANNPGVYVTVEAWD